MALVSDTQKAAGKLARYVEEFQEFFASHKMHCGSPNDLLELARHMEGAGTFRDELSSMVRSVIFREGGNVPRAELLKLVTTSIGGPQLDDTAGHLQEPISQLMSYLTGVVRAPKNQPVARDIRAAAPEPSLDSPASDGTPDPPLQSSPQKPATPLSRPADLRATSDLHPAALSQSEQEANNAGALLEAVRLVELKNLELKTQLGSLYERISRMDARPEPAAKGSSSQAVHPESATTLPAPALPASTPAAPALAATTLAAPTLAATTLPAPALPSSSRPPSEYLDAPAADQPISAHQFSLDRKQGFQPEVSPASIEELAHPDLADQEAIESEDDVLDKDPWNENSDLQKVLRRFAEQKAAQDKDLSFERPGLFARLGSSGYVKWFAGSAVLLMLMLIGIALRHRGDTASLSDPARVQPGVAATDGGLPKPNPYDSRDADSRDPGPRDPAAARPDILSERSNQAAPGSNQVPGSIQVPGSNQDSAGDRDANAGSPTSPISGHARPSDEALAAEPQNFPASQSFPAQSDAQTTTQSGQAGTSVLPDARGKTKSKLSSKDAYATNSAQPLGLNVSSGVMAGNLISAPAPQYPKIASFTHIQGQVLLQAIISKNGTVEHLHVVRGHRLLRGAAMDAVHRWRYRPYVVNGRPVDVATIIRVDFQLHR